MPPHAQRVPEKKVTACVGLWRLRMSQVLNIPRGHTMDVEIIYQ